MATLAKMRAKVPPRGQWFAARESIPAFGSSVIRKLRSQKSLDEMRPTREFSLNEHSVCFQ